jgi:Zn-dependent M28 family amino/carboxypeptidase
MAERDENESKRNQPIDGANDGASGVAVLIELGKIIPNLELNHDVTLFFTDAEDQGITGGFHPLTWSYGAYAWVENLTEEYKNNISAYIVIDMIGDAYLDFTKVKDTSGELWDTITPIAAALGMMESELDCEGNYGEPIYDPNTTRGVIDDHVPANNAGIPAINFIDINYGENASVFGGHWHTHEDTADKVSSESLGYIGNLLELGLITSAWTLNPMDTNELTNESNQGDNTLETNEDLENNVEKSNFVGYLSIIIVSAILILILVADISLKL